MEITRPPEKSIDPADCALAGTIATMMVTAAKVTALMIMCIPHCLQSLGCEHNC